MEHDDKPVGRVLSRREILTLLGSAGTVALLGGGFRALAADTIYLPIVMQSEGATTPVVTATSIPTATATLVPTAEATAIPACVVSPELTEGPYFVDEQLNRADIRADPTDGTVRAGGLLQLTLRAYRVSGGTCSPLAGAIFDIWHCDALGLYSDVQSEGTAGKKFLRGYQVTDSNGTVQFSTIYPGWYRGRAVHIHFKLRSDLTTNPSYEFTSQFFFDDTLSDQVFTQTPYVSKGTRDTRNSQDNIYAQGGSQLLLTPTSTDQGYAATFDIGLAIT